MMDGQRPRIQNRLLQIKTMFTGLTSQPYLEAPLAGRKRRGQSIDIETGDLILEPHQQEYWVVKRNMMGHIIDLYRVETDDEIR
jgi:hypothetical protein